MYEFGLKHRELGRDRSLFERIGLGTFFFRRDIDGDHVLAALEQRLQHGLAEGLLAVDHDTHSMFLPYPLMLAKAGIQCL